MPEQNMGMLPSTGQRRWRFGPFEFDESLRELRKNGLRIHIQDQPALILKTLLTCAGEVVSREELRAVLWPTGTYVEFERGLNTAVAKLRQVLVDSAEKPRYVETVAGKGYQFIARAELCPQPEPPPVQAPLRQSVASLTHSRWTWLGAALAFATFACIGIYAVRSERPKSAPGISFVIPPPFGTRIHPISAISPDGSKLALVTEDVTGRRSLWLRALDAETAIRLEQTEGAASPFFSPDSQHVGFFSDGKLKRIPVSGGAAQMLCAVNQPAGGTWNRGGVILFSQSGRLYRVPAQGGEPVELPQPGSVAGETRIDAWPQFLPDGRRFIVSSATHAGQINWLRAEIFLGALDTTERKHLVKARSRAAITPDGHLLFRRDLSLVAQPIDLESGQLTGQARTVAEDLSPSSGEVLVDVKPGLPVAVGPATFSASDNGVLAFHTRPSTRKQLVWFDREGKRLGKAGEPGDYMHMALSPDEQNVALAVRLKNSWYHWNLSVLELNSNVLSQLTNGEGRDADPAWSPDSRRIVYGTYHAEEGEQVDLMEVKLGERTPRRIHSDGQSNKPETWSADGAVLLARRNEQILFSLPMSGQGKSAVLLQTPHVRHGFRFSPDGRWLVYVSTESGAPVVFVTRYPEMTATRQVSAGSGFAPVWRKDGKELYYMTPQGAVVSVRVNGGARLDTGAPKVLFRSDAQNVNMPQFAVTQNGQRFLVLEVLPSHVADERLVVRTGWLHQIKP